MSDVSVHELHEEVRRLSTMVEAEHSRRRAFRTWVSVCVAGLAVGASAVAFAAPYVCTSGPLPLSMTCFVPNAPALANDVNGNFKTLGDAVVAAQSASAALATRVSTLEGQATTATTRLDTLYARERTISGEAFFTFNSCGGSPGGPCRINIASAGFGTAPNCVLTMRNVDNTGYKEHMVIADITATELQIWRGQFGDSGTTMVVRWICSGR